MKTIKCPGLGDVEITLAINWSRVERIITDEERKRLNEWCEECEIVLASAMEDQIIRDPI